MKTFTTVLIAFLVLAGCERGPYPKVRVEQHTANICDASTREERSSMILECIRGGNPKSDEEPEDWIGICEEMAERTYCPLEVVNITYHKACHNCWWEEANVEVVK